MNKASACKISGIYLVTEDYMGKTHLDFARAALEAGVRIIQYREKKKASRKMLEEAAAIAGEVKKYGGIFIVNDRVDIALACGADGVHVGADDLDPLIVRKIAGENFIIGVSVSSAEEARAAEEKGADYVAVSPLYATSTKEDAGEGLGIETLKQVKSKVKIPVVAIGGINRDNLAEVLGAGADSAAVVSAITRAENPYHAAKELVMIFREIKGGKSE